MRVRDLDGDREGLEASEEDAGGAAAAGSNSEVFFCDGTDGTEAEDEARERGIQKKQSQTIEPVFGQIKQGRGIDSFYGRDLSSAQGEWNGIYGTHNLRKLFSRVQAERN